MFVNYSAYQRKKISQGLCVEKKCMNKPRDGRKQCNNCACKKWRERNPLKATFNTLKYNAKRRNKVFELTLEDFIEIINDSEYMEKKGIHPEDLTLDRIINELGYIKGNVRVIKNKANLDKRNYYDYRTKEIAAPSRIQIINSDVPFIFLLGFSTLGFFL